MMVSHTKLRSGEILGVRCDSTGGQPKATEMYYGKMCRMRRTIFCVYRCYPILDILHTLQLITLVLFHFAA